MKTKLLLVLAVIATAPVTAAQHYTYHNHMPTTQYPGTIMHVHHSVAEPYVDPYHKTMLQLAKNSTLSDNPALINELVIYMQHTCSYGQKWQLIEALANNPSTSKSLLLTSLVTDELKAKRERDAAIYAFVGQAIKYVALGALAVGTALVAFACAQAGYNAVTGAQTTA